MPHSAQARKRVRQSEKLRIRNKSVRSEIKTLTKALQEKVAAKDVEGAKALFRKVVSTLDKAAKVNVYHRNATARKKSQAARLVQSIETAAR
jgi:small subunit ribosomal protein S20